MPILLKGEDITLKVDKYNSQQLRQTEIVPDEVLTYLMNDPFIQYIQKLKGKTKVGTFFFANGDEVGMIGGAALGTTAAILTGGAAIAAIPGLALGGQQIGAASGSVTNEKKLAENFIANYKQVQKDLQAKKTTLTGTASNFLQQNMKLIIIGVIVILIFIIWKSRE